MRHEGVGLSGQTSTHTDGPFSFSEERLLEIATSTRQIAFWVRLWSILTVVGVGLSVLLFVVRTAGASSGVTTTPSPSAGSGGLVYVLVGLGVLVAFGVVAGLAYLGWRGAAPTDRESPAAAYARHERT